MSNQRSKRVIAFVLSILMLLTSIHFTQLWADSEEEAELLEEARNTKTDMNPEEDSSSASSSNSSGYSFVGWENWPTDPVSGPLVIRGLYNKA